MIALILGFLWLVFSTCTIILGACVVDEIREARQLEETGHNSSEKWRCSFLGTLIGGVLGVITITLSVIWTQYAGISPVLTITHFWLVCIVGFVMSQSSGEK